MFLSYEDYVVQQAFVQETGVGMSSSCSSDLFSGLIYVGDNIPAFESTGGLRDPLGSSTTISGLYTGRDLCNHPPTLRYKWGNAG